MNKDYTKHEIKLTIFLINLTLLYECPMGHSYQQGSPLVRAGVFLAQTATFFVFFAAAAWA
jgi:hypothetical protein